VVAVAAGRAGDRWRAPVAGPQAARAGRGVGRVLAAVRPARRAHAVPVVRHRAPVCLGQREPAVVQPAVPAVAAGGVAAAARAPAGALVPRAAAGGDPRGGWLAAAEVGDAVLAGQPAVDRAAAADPPGPVPRVAPAGADAS